MVPHYPGMEKINFSGGEPFIKENGRYVGELVRYSKQKLQLPSVSIVSNGSLITEQWFEDYGKIIMLINYGNLSLSLLPMHCMVMLANQ